MTKRGSIDLARSLCYEIAGPTDEEDDMTGSDYGSVDIAEILSAEVERLRAQAIDLRSAFTAVWINADRSEWDGKAIQHFDSLMEDHNAD
jgi:hypothetical protein